MNSTQYFNKIINIFINIENIRIYNDRIRKARSNYFLTVLISGIKLYSHVMSKPVYPQRAPIDELHNSTQTRNV